MKIKCDVCDKEEASVFCSADEASLCEACDRRVHHANKLASKHQRFSLVHPSSKDSPRCDICQDRRALVFCKEDRALLCRECDIPIHKANVHTQNHNRFLLTGIKLSADCSSPQQKTSSSSSSVSKSNLGTRSKNDNSNNNSSRVSKETVTPNYSTTLNTSESTSNPCSIDSHCIIQEGSVSTSSISEYLMETLPGWHVEDFLDPPSCSPFGFCKTDDQMSSSPSSTVEDESSLGKFSIEGSTVWNLHFQNGIISGSEGTLELKDFKKVGRERNREDIRVPRINPPFF